jgi:hypothetical protein
MDQEDLSFWRWFGRGGRRKAGWGRLLWNGWTPVHCAVGVALGILVPLDLSACANAVLFPLAGVLVGLTFAWAGNAQGLLQTEEMQELARHRDRGLRVYVFTYQTTVLVLLFALVLWGLAGLGLFDLTLFGFRSPYPYTAVKCLLFCVTSVAVRECWQVVVGTHWTLLVKEHLAAEKRRRGNTPPRP